MEDATGTEGGDRNAGKPLPQVNTFVLKAEGDKVTGTIVSDMMGTQQITEGKLAGDKITFAVTSVSV